MLVSSVTQFQAVALLQLGELTSGTVVHAATIVSPALDHLIEPATVENVQAFGAHTIAMLPANQLTPSAVINAQAFGAHEIENVVPPPDTSYANVGGTGNRTAIITVTTDAALGGGTTSNLVDGAIVSNDVDAMWWNNGQSGRRLTFDFGVGEAVLINEARIVHQTAATHGTWKWQGSNNGTDWTDLSVGFTLGGVHNPTPGVMGDMSANVTSYRYYSILQTAGVTSSNPYHQEWEFKILGL